jgi:hypothetical protein
MVEVACDLFDAPRGHAVTNEVLFFVSFVPSLDEDYNMIHMLPTCLLSLMWKHQNFGI